MARRTDPFQDIEQIFDMMTGGGNAGGGVPVDVADAGDEFVVAVDLPGFEQDDIEVKLLDETTLYLAGESEQEAVAEADRYVTRERSSRSVSRRVGLPAAVEESETSAAFENGVLTVTLPKRTSAPDEGTDIPVN